jgi:hypothetical protein
MDEGVTWKFVILMAGEEQETGGMIRNARTKTGIQTYDDFMATPSFIRFTDTIVQWLSHVGKRKYMPSHAAGNHAVKMI